MMKLVFSTAIITSLAFAACGFATAQVVQSTEWFRSGELWVGEGVQPGFGKWSIEVTFNADGSATIDYPSIPCGGALTPLSSTTGRAAFRETITRSASKCTNLGTVTLTEIDPERLDYVYESPQGSVSRGSLSLATIPATTALSPRPEPRPASHEAELPNSEATLPSKFPTFYKELEALAGAEPIVAKLAKEAAVTLLNMAYSPTMNRLIFHKVGVEGRLLAEWALRDPDAFLAASRSSATNLGTDMALEIAVGLAADALADAIMNAPQFDSLDPIVAAATRGLITGIVEEGWWFTKAASTGDPTEIFSAGIDRGLEVVEIYRATRGVIETRDQAFIATALALQTAVELESNSSRESSKRVSEAIYQDLVANAAQIYGSDDAAELNQILGLARDSLRAAMRGDVEQARKSRDEMLRLTRPKGEKSLAMLTSPQEWIDAARNWGKVTPQRAAAILVQATRIGQLEDPAVVPDSTEQLIDPADVRKQLEEVGRLLGLDSTAEPLASAETYKLARSPEGLVPECAMPNEAKWLGQQLGTRAKGPLRYVWTGKCKNGVPSGNGQIIALDQNEEVEWYWVVGPNSLLGLDEAGQINFDVPLPGNTIECGVLRTARLNGSGAFQAADLANDFLLASIFARAADAIVEKCGGNGYRNISVTLDHPGFPARPGWNEGFRGRNYDADTLTWQEWTNGARHKRSAEIDKLNTAMRQRRQAAERAQREQAMAERRALLLKEWTDRVEQQLSGSAPIENLADLLKYDRLRTLQALADGRKIRIALTEPGFRNGQFVVTNRQKAFDVDEALAGSGFTWQNWIRMTQNFGMGEIEIACLFQADDIGELQQGQTYSVEAELVDASGSTLLLQCVP